MGNVGIIIESKNHKVTAASLGMITLAKSQGADVTAFIPQAVADAVQADLAAHGVTRMVGVSFPSGPAMATNPDIWARTLTHAIKEYKILNVFGLSSARGKNLLPRIAALLDAPLVMDCTHVDLKDKVAVTSQYSGKTMAKIKVHGAVTLFGIRPKAIEPVKQKEDIQQVLFVAKDRDDSTFRVVEELKDPSQDSDSKGISLSEADVIIAGGRGMKNKENFDVLFACAKKLNAAVGASRVAVDSGWVPYAMQVGQTGEKVSPKVYIACGISGSIQHFAGMKTSDLVLAINTDENAAIMANADYIIKGDLFEIIPELTRLLEDS
ncbi:MAG: electron transfer flavoprotein subunit alpha/FixB family protein [Desulfobacteraceae bacterium]|nr:electron transfer flavoprotein subunit alpha/FixB family protein [Desulfobacteraceae bacterium]